MSLYTCYRECYKYNCLTTQVEFIGVISKKLFIFFKYWPLIVLHWILISLNCALYWWNHVPIPISENNLLEDSSASPSPRHTQWLNISLPRKWDLILPFLKGSLNFTSDFLGTPSLTFNKGNQLSLWPSLTGRWKETRQWPLFRMIYLHKWELRFPSHSRASPRADLQNRHTTLSPMCTWRLSCLERGLFWSESCIIQRKIITTLTLCTIKKKKSKLKTKASGTRRFQSVTHTTIYLPIIELCSLLPWYLP